MPFYEVIFETGAYSVCEYENDEVAREAIKAHNDRAINGEAGGPAGLTAERVKKVLVYETHPATLNENQLLSTDVAAAEVQALIAETSKDGVISIPELAARIRDMTNPSVGDSAPHESNYKATEIRELAWQ